MNKHHSTSLPEISKKAALNLILKSQLLLDPETSDKKEFIHKVITQLGYIQIDTISVTERSVNHVIWSRAGNFDRNIINELFSEKKIYEFWSHAAALLPMKDYRYSHIFKHYYIEKYGSFKKSNRKLLKFVKDRIKSEGPLMSRDFEGFKKGESGWWNRKPTKEALEFLFFSGELMVKERVGFQKVYDLTERILPSDIDDSFPTEQDYHKHLILTSINANGIIERNEITYLRKNNTKILMKALNELMEEKIICGIRVNGIDYRSYFTLPQLLKESNSKSSGLKILSPFDNLIIQRKRVKTFFDFDYQLECYLPQEKRMYGYFTLPVLYKNKFIGRIDLKSDRKIKTLNVINFFPEEGIPINKIPIVKLKSLLNDFALFTGCEKVTGFQY